MDQPYPMASLLADDARIQILIGRPDWIHKALSPDNTKIALIGKNKALLLTRQERHQVDRQ